MIILSIILLALQFADVYSTKLVISSGKGHEANPVMKFILNHTGFTGMLISKLMIIGLICYYTTNPYILAILIVSYMFVVYHNMKVYKN